MSSSNEKEQAPVDESLIKKVRNLTILASAVYFILGLTMYLWPDEMWSLIAIILGIISLVLGIVRLILYFTKDRFAAMIAYDLVIGILFTVLGVLILIFHGQVMDYIAVVFGIFLLLGSIIKVQNAIDLNRIGMKKWWIVLIFAGMSIVFAILLIVKPDFIKSMLMKITGIFLMIDGLTGIVTIIIYAFRFRKYKKELKQASMEVVDEAPEAVGTEAQNSGTAEASSDNEGAGSTAEEETDVPSSDITAADAAEDTAAAADSTQAAGQMAVPPTAPMGNNFDPNTGLPIKK